MELKTYQSWHGSLSEYLQPGDMVDEEMADYFLTVMPPVTYTSSMIQMGDPYSHIDGRATYYTLVREDNRWIFIGVCFRGEPYSPH